MPLCQTGGAVLAFQLLRFGLRLCGYLEPSAKQQLIGCVRWLSAQEHPLWSWQSSHGFLVGWQTEHRIALRGQSVCKVAHRLVHSSSVITIRHSRGFANRPEGALRFFSASNNASACASESLLLRVFNAGVASSSSPVPTALHLNALFCMCSTSPLMMTSAFVLSLHVRTQLLCTKCLRAPHETHLYCSSRMLR